MSQQDALTPPDFWSVLQDEFAFQIDCAAHDDRLCERYITAEEDALLESTLWLPDDVERAYCNPPFKNMRKWIEKAHAEAQKKPNSVIGVLGPLSRALWFRFAEQHAHEIRIVHPRVEFNPPPWHEGTWSQNRQDVVLVIFRKNPPNHPGARIWTWNLTGRISARRLKTGPKALI